MKEGPPRPVRLKKPPRRSAWWGSESNSQGIVRFAEYLETAAVILAPEAERIKRDCRQLFDAGRKAVDSTDPAYRVCPTLEQLMLPSPN